MERRLVGTAPLWAVGLALLATWGRAQDSSLPMLERLERMDQAQLDRLYESSPIGEIPNGFGRGRVLLVAGSVLATPLQELAAVLWQGKVFNVKDGTLINRVLGMELVKAKIYSDASWFDGKPAIIVDYAPTSVFFSGIRDEFRLVAPGVYLGRACSRLDKACVLSSFVLDFNGAPADAADTLQESPEENDDDIEPQSAAALRQSAADLAPMLSQLGEGPSLSAGSARDIGRQIEALLTGAKDIAAGPSVPSAGRTEKAVGGVPSAIGPALPYGAVAETDVPTPEAAREATLARELEKSNFSEVWEVLQRDRLSAPFPSEEVTLWSFFKGMSFRLLGSARRTLSDHRDLLPDFQKLIRPNGIGLQGVWRVTEPTPYTGYFASGSQALVIARASVFSDEVAPGQYRSFGLALKLYPSGDAADPAKHKTANVFLIDDNGGTLARHFTDAALTTHPPLSFHWGLLWKAPTLLLVSLAQRLADSKPGYRQLYPVSELGVPPAALADVKTPGRLMLRGSAETTRIDAPDFREELDPARYPAPGLKFDIYVAEGKDSEWQIIGSVVFTQSVVSHAVDHNLHFPHPPYRKKTAAGY